jgi:hypothetical protein
MTFMSPPINLLTSFHLCLKVDIKGFYLSFGGKKEANLSELFTKCLTTRGVRVLGQ